MNYQLDGQRNQRSNYESEDTKKKTNLVCVKVTANGPKLNEIYVNGKE